jgi:hypothetical protein
MTNDFATRTVSGVSVPPSDYANDTDGAAVDLAAGDGSAFALLAIGNVFGQTQVGGRIEESANGSTGWAAIPGATFATQTTPNVTRAIRFTRTQRYVRAVLVLGGVDPQVAAAIVIGQPRKTF